MNMHPVYGHEVLRQRLAGSIASGRFPQSALFVGLPGVGKQRLALWAAQTLLCEADSAMPCGSCESCRHAVGLSHPDLHWFIPIGTLKSGEREKRLAEARELLAEAVGERRDKPVYARAEGMIGHPLASIRVLHRLASLKPFSGPRKVFIVGDADRLVVQEASQEAANALLKILEEPPSNTYIILTTPEPQALLPTIRSRLVPIRVPRLPDDIVAEFLRRELHPPPDEASIERRVLLAGGSIGRAVWTEDSADEADGAAEEFLTAVRRGAHEWPKLALAQAPWQARGDFTSMLDALALRVRSELEEAAASYDQEGLSNYLSALDAVESTRAEAQGNVNPQLALAVLAQELEDQL